MRPLKLAFLISALLSAGSVWAIPPKSHTSDTQVDTPAAAFETAYQAARAKAAKAFEAAEPIDKKVLDDLDILALTPQDKLKAAALRKHIKEMENLKLPVRGKLLPVRTVKIRSYALEEAYKAKVLKMATALKADGGKAVATRLRLLKEGKSRNNHAGIKPGQRPETRTKEEIEKHQKESAARGEVTIQNATAIGDLLGQDYKKTSALTGGHVFSPLENTVHKSGVVGVHASAFRPEYNGTIDGNVPTLYYEEPPPEEKGFWGKAWEKAVTPWEGAKDAYAGFAERRMEDSDRLEAEGASMLAEGGVGNTISAGWNSARAWGNRLLAADEETVKQAAIGTAVVVGGTILAIAAAPVIAAVAAGGAISVTVGGVATGAAVVVKAGLLGYTSAMVVKSTADLAKQPNLVNAGLLAMFAIPIPFLEKGTHAVVGGVTKHVVRAGTSIAKVEAKGALMVGATTTARTLANRAAQIEVKTLAGLAEIKAHQMAHGAVHHVAVDSGAMGDLLDPNAVH